MADSDAPQGFGRLKRMAKRFVGGEKPNERPADVKVERRAGKRVSLNLALRLTMDSGSTWEARVLEINRSGLSLEPAEDVQVSEGLSVGFDGYPDVCPPFTLLAHVRRVLTDNESGARTGIAIEIDRKSSAAEALENYRRLVLHYLHHKPLLDDMNKGYFEGRCESCDWVGRVGERRAVCAKCGGSVVPV